MHFLPHAEQLGASLLDKLTSLLTVISGEPAPAAATHACQTQHGVQSVSRLCCSHTAASAAVQGVQHAGRCSCCSPFQDCLACVVCDLFTLWPPAVGALAFTCQFK